MDGEAQLVQEFLERNRWQGLETAIHADDEMRATIGEHHPPPRRDLEYFRSGAEVLSVLEHYGRALGRPFENTARLLDFACGCGRVSRYFVHRLGGERVWAADIDRVATDFVGNTLGAQTFYSGTDPDAIALPGPFDLIFVGSLFTHLPRSRFVPWLRCLYRALAPGGSLVFSTHPEQLLAEPRRDPSGFSFVRQSETERLDLSEYGSTYLSADAGRELGVEAGVASLTHRPGELWYFHDLWIARNEEAPELSQLAPLPMRFGRIDGIAWEGDEVRVGGHVRHREGSEAVRRLVLRLDGEEISRVAPGEGEVRREGVVPWRFQPWQEAGSADLVSPGVHVLSLAAEGSDGGGEEEYLDSALLERPAV